MRNLVERDLAGLHAAVSLPVKTGEISLFLGLVTLLVDLLGDSSYRSKWAASDIPSVMVQETGDGSSNDLSNSMSRGMDGAVESLDGFAESCSTIVFWLRENLGAFIADVVRVFKQLRRGRCGCGEEALAV